MDHATDVPGIAIVRSSRSWARTLHRYVVDHGGAVVRTRPLEERQAIEEEYDILVVDDISSFLTNHIVEELHRRNRRVLGVYDPNERTGSAEEHSGRQRLTRLGVDGIIESGAAPEEYVRVIQELAPPRVRHTPAEVAASSTSGTGLVLAPPLTLAGFDPELDGDIVVPRSGANARGRRGHVTAVLGASGGSGATEIAIELARALGRRGERTVVVDGDELAPAMAQRLNLALHPNLRTAVDVVEHGTGRLSECLTAIANNLEVLVGLPHPKDWVEVRGTDMTAVLEELARGRPQVVVNTSPSIEDLATYGGPDRFGLSRSALSAADLIVIVCPPSPMGVSRLLDRVADLTEFTTNKPVHVVVNRTTKGSFKVTEIAREIERSFAPAGIHFIASDSRVERASWDGTLVPGGDFTKSLQSLMAAIPEAELAGRQRATAPEPTALSGPSGSAGAPAPAKGFQAWRGHLRPARKGA